MGCWIILRRSEGQLFVKVLANHEEADAAGAYHDRPKKQYFPTVDLSNPETKTIETRCF